MWPTFMQRWPLLIAALWWGGVSAMSFVAVPMLFAFFGNLAVAGPMAAQLFQAQAWGSVGAALLLLVWGRTQRGVGDDAALNTGLLPWLLLGALAGMVQEFGVAQQILTARSTGGSVRLWHSLGSALVLMQWLCALRSLWWIAGKQAQSR
jgi:Domain of unknown function (DUF4149)